MNPGLTQTQFTYIGKRLFYLLGKLFELRQHRFRFERGEVRVEDYNDKNSNTSEWVLYGVNPGVNTDANGEIFIRVTGAGPYTVKGYTAAGASGEVFAAAAGAVGDTVAISASSSSGITGTVKLGATVTAETDDVHKIRCFVDYLIRDVQVFNGDETYDATLREAVIASNAAVASLLKDAEAQLVTVVKTCLTDYVAARINAASKVALDKGTDVQDGAVSLVIQGILEELRLAMIDNTTPQTVIQAVIAAGAVAFASGNTGLGSMVTPTMLEKAIPGLLTWRCTDETLGAEKFTATHRRSDDGTLIESKNALYVGKEWKDPDIGVASAILLRTLTKTGDGSNLYLSALSSGWSISGESTANTNSGVLYWSVTNNTGAYWDISFYKSSARLATDLVAKATAIVNGASFTASAQRRSGLTISGVAGSTMAAATGTLLLNCFKSGPPADTFTSTITRTSSGEIQKFLAELLPEELDWYLKGDSSATLPDSLMTRGVVTIYGRN